LLQNQSCLTACCDPAFLDENPGHISGEGAAEHISSILLPWMLLSLSVDRVCETDQLNLENLLIFFSLSTSRNRTLRL
uniref:Uncharacterized protein n=1 Tax=Cairina moschata TaxID=8855 RepID=A0A8C3GJB2_CAIMO